MPTYLTAPDGSRWAVVPVKATDKMAHHGQGYSDLILMSHRRDGLSKAENIKAIDEEVKCTVWPAMLAAAPEFPGETTDAIYQRGLREGLEMAAKLIEGNCIMSSGTVDNPVLRPRIDGYQHGCEYATAIRALSPAIQATGRE